MIKSSYILSNFLFYYRLVERKIKNIVLYQQDIMSQDSDDKPARNNKFSGRKWEHDRYSGRQQSSFSRGKGRNQQRNYDRSRDRKYNDQRHNNYQNPRNNRNHQYMDDVQIRTISSTVQVQPPKTFLIADNALKNQESITPKFEVNVVSNEKYPEKQQSRLTELKFKITPIQKIWASHIKQYLNDSEFVEIYRKGKSLAHQKIEYGKTMIKYRQHRQLPKQKYDNEAFQSNIFSRAYFKLWQILSMGIFEGKQNQKLNIACVAQGPGGFIHSIIDFRNKINSKIKDSFYSITLKIDKAHTRNAKDWSDFRASQFFNHMRKQIGISINLSYGSTGTGDLLKQQNIDYFALKQLDERKCFLVTGDGGIECIGDKQFDYQEVFNAKLFLGEIITGMKVQATGGTFILKVYDCSFQLTRQLLALLAVFYEKVQMVKPITSRPGNSQKYMVCRKFRGMTIQQQQNLKIMLKKWTAAQPKLSYFENEQFVHSVINFPKQQIDYTQVRGRLLEANEYFLKQQQSKLEEGLALAKDCDNDASKIEQLLLEKRFKEQMSYAWKWCQKYGIKAIDVKIEGQDTQSKMNQQ